MSFAFLFDPTTIRGNYGEWSRGLMFRSAVLQHSNREIRIRVGDLLYYKLPDAEISPEEIRRRIEETNASPSWLREPLEQALWKHRIHAIFCEELDEATAQTLHTFLLDEARYMGCYGVNLALGLHRWLFEFALILSYRVRSRECWAECADEIEELESLACFERVRHVPVLESEFVDPDEWDRYRADCSPEHHLAG